MWPAPPNAHGDAVFIHVRDEFVESPHLGRASKRLWLVIVLSKCCAVPAEIIASLYLSLMKLQTCFDPGFIHAKVIFNSLSRYIRFSRWFFM